jgi:hypothetical protein
MTDELIMDYFVLQKMAAQAVVPIWSDLQRTN